MLVWGRIGPDPRIGCFISDLSPFPAFDAADSDTAQHDDANCTKKRLEAIHRLLTHTQAYSSCGTSMSMADDCTKTTPAAKRATLSATLAAGDLQNDTEEAAALSALGSSNWNPDIAIGVGSC